MTAPQTETITIRGGFTLTDFGYDPKFDLPKTKSLDVENLNPEPGILAEYEELFGEDGYVERSMLLDGIGGVYDLPTQLRMAAARRMAGVQLPPKAGLILAARMQR